MSIYWWVGGGIALFLLADWLMGEYKSNIMRLWERFERRIR